MPKRIDIEKLWWEDGALNVMEKETGRRFIFEDVGFWYQNLKASLGELDQVSLTASQLEKSNLLIKLRETLLDQGKEGISITSPDGISRFPLNTAYAIAGIIFFVLFIVGGIGTIISFNILTD